VRDVREEWGRLEGRVCCLEEEVEIKDRRTRKVESGNLSYHIIDCRVE